MNELIQEQPSMATDAQPHRNIRKIGTIVFVIVLVIIVCYFGFPYIAGVFYRDLSTLNDSHLIPSSRAVPNNDNSYFILEDPNNPSAQEINHIPGGIAKLIDEGDLDKTLEDIGDVKNELVNIIHQAASRAHYQNPLFDNNPDYEQMNNAYQPRLFFYRVAGAVTTAVAASNIQHGNISLGVEQLMDTASVGHQLMNSNGSVLEHLVGYYLKQSALLRLSSQMGSVSDVAALEDIKQRLSKFEDNRPGLIYGIQNEYQFVRAGILKAARTGMIGELNDSIKIPRAPYYFMPNRTLNMYLIDAERELNNINEEYCTTAELKDISPAIKDLNSFSLRFMPNFTGKIIYDTSAYSMRGVILKSCADRFLVRTLQLILAIRQYQINEGASPADLAVLEKSGYLKAMPQDPYSKEPLRWNEKGVYGAGEDGVFSGGSEGEDWTKMADPTIQVPF